MTEGKATLEGKLNGNVCKGDIVLLHSESVDVSGYVCNFNSERIILSHEDPFTSVTWGGGSYDRGIRKNLGRGDKTYNLSRFESYEVIRKYNLLKNKE